jgi:hypothetical protein
MADEAVAEAGGKEEEEEEEEGAVPTAMDTA